MKPEKIDPKSIRMEDGASELTASEAMRLYQKLATAVVKDTGIGEAMEEIGAVPLV